jgi:hypothetical protein
VSLTQSPRFHLILPSAPDTCLSPRHVNLSPSTSPGQTPLMGLLEPLGLPSHTPPA